LTLLRPSDPTEEELAQSAIRITIGNQFSDRMAPEVAEIPITPVIEAANSSLPADEKNSQTVALSSNAPVPGWFVALIMVLVTVGLLILAAIVYLIRMREIKRRHRRERLAQLRRNYQDSQIRYR
ncbi:MAG: hypothetical protein LRY35_06530, partial [Clostridiales bacterium]|nr:hypothetical protein [Clostridiales bacterium]